MADNSKYIQAQKFALAVGISTTDTSITLQSFDFPDGSAIASGDIGAINYGTLEPGTTREEQISFTGFTTNGDSTVTLTGVVRGVGFGAVDTYSEQSDLKVQHGAGSQFIISNTSAFYDKFVNKENDETINGTLSVPTPTSNAHAASKEYVDTASLGGALSQDRVVQAGTAGESVAAGDLVYFDDTDNEWKKTDGTTATTLNNVLLGIAQGAGSDGGSIDGGVLTYGLDSNQTGQTVSVKLYASDTAGAIAESAGTVEKVIGFSKSATEIYFDPNFDSLPTSDEKEAMAGGGDFGSPSTSNKYLTENYIPNVGTLLTTGVTKKIGTLSSVSEIAAGVTTETNIISQTVSGNLLSTNNGVRIRCLVNNLSVNASDTVTFRLKYGSTTLTTLTTDTLDTDAEGLIGVLEGVILANGATDSQTASLFLDVAEGNSDPDNQLGVNGGVFLKMIGTGSATEDSTGDLDVSLTIQWDSTNATNDFVPAGVTMELIS